MGLRGRVIAIVALVLAGGVSACASSDTGRSVDYDSYPFEVTSCDHQTGTLVHEYDDASTELAITHVTAGGTVKNNNDEEIEVTLQVDFSKPQFFAYSDSDDHPRHRRTEVKVVVPANGTQTWTADIESEASNIGDDGFFVESSKYPGASNMSCEIDDYDARFTADPAAG